LLVILDKVAASQRSNTYTRLFKFIYRMVKK